MLLFFSTFLVAIKNKIHIHLAQRQSQTDVTFIPEKMICVRVS